MSQFLAYINVCLLFLCFTDTQNTKPGLATVANLISYDKGQKLRFLKIICNAVIKILIFLQLFLKFCSFQLMCFELIFVSQQNFTCKSGVSNSWASGGQFAYMSNGAEGLITYVSNRADGHTWLWIWGSPPLWETTAEIWPQDGSISKKRSSPFWLQKSCL